MTNSVDFQAVQTLFFNFYSMYGIYGLFLPAISLYSVSLVIYRLYLHPLARIPGPKIAAATGWYEFYHDVIRGGMYIHEVQKMHREYGPIIRINPYEIVIKDPDYYNTVYVASNTRRSEKWYTLQGTGLDGKELFFIHD
ncbi:uncharacterized protein LDX57_001511 [Aspergillus melleus]|uniref:uncharacterized protein n=1 Tax=Aspergillus melleus TaxID=138277 RepID=UPI001E8DB9FD|nr:uncharacterized protein LDX57_001511 [Aspergillus melleus]KAH8423755.1 hypothetical protein LDX57_001511 [Aspergillus melleus]